jgi:hypothetical protein
MDWMRWLAPIGLMLDIVGVLLLWKFGLPESIDRSGAVYLVSEEVDQTEVAKAKLYDRLGRLGIGLIATGFALQLVGGWPRASSTP